MKKSALPLPAISYNAPLAPLDFNAMLTHIIQAKGKEKKAITDTLFLAMRSKELAPGEFVHFSNLQQTAPCPNNVAPIVKRYNLELQIQDERKAFNKAASKYNRLEEKCKNLQKKKINIEGKIQKNEHQLQVGIMEVQAKRHQLALLFDNRKNYTK